MMYRLGHFLFEHEFFFFYIQASTVSPAVL